MPNDALAAEAQAVAAPVAPPAPSADPASGASAPEPSASPEGAPPDPEGTVEPPKPEAKPDKLLSQDEVNRIVRRERRAAETRAYERARLEAENQRLREQLGAPRGDEPARNTQGVGERPKPESFKDWDAYNEALIDWKVEQRRDQEFHRARQGQEQDAFVRYATEVRETLAKDADQYEDFEEVIAAPGVVFTDAMVDAVIRTPKPAAVAYYLGQHPQESQRIGRLSLAMQVLEVQKISAQINKPPAPSKAPEPIKPNAGSAAGVEPTLESAANNYQEWLRLRNRQLGKSPG